MMKAILFRKHGRSSVLTLGEAPEPKVGPGEVRVRLKAAALNHLDIWVRMGIPGMKLSLPHIPGSDGAGVVTDRGDGVKGIQIGDRVVVSPGMGCGECPYCRGGWDSICDGYQLLGLQVPGTYAESIVVPERRVIKVSDKLSFEEWASVGLVFVTAWHMLHTHAHIKSSDRVLIHAAGSGVGQAAIAIARRAGCEIFTTVGSDLKAVKAKDLGAHHVINYRKKNFAKEVLSRTDQKGADLIFEHIGPDTWAKNMTCLAKAGRLVTCGATSGPKVEIDLRFLFMKQQRIMGSYMGSDQELHEVIELLESGELKTIVDKTFPLKDARKAHDYMESRKGFGKIVLAMD